MNKTKQIKIIGILLTLGPIWGIIGTVIGMMGAFKNINETGGMIKAEALSGNIEFALYTTLIGFIMCPIGVVLLVMAFRSKKSVDEVEDLEPTN